jgi:hypothetical protein
MVLGRKNYRRLLARNATHIALIPQASSNISSDDLKNRTEGLMGRSIRGFAAISGLVFAIALGHTTTAWATVAHNAGLAGPGTYFGSGNANTNWTVNTQGGVELGLQTLIRYTGPVVAPTPTTSSTYYVPLGIYSTKGALWDFAFSVNTNVGNANPSLMLSNITTTLTVHDVANGTTGSVDPLGEFLDNAGYTGTSTYAYNCVSHTNSAQTIDALSSPYDCSTSAQSNQSIDYGFQNSDPLSFNAAGTADKLANDVSDPNFNANQNDTYVVTLSASDGSGSLGSVTETIIAGTGAPVPEPRDVAILGVGLLGLVVAHRAGRRQARVRARTSH